MSAILFTMIVFCIIWVYYYNLTNTNIFHYCYFVMYLPIKLYLNLLMVNWGR